MGVNLALPGGEGVVGDGGVGGPGRLSRNGTTTVGVHKCRTPGEATRIIMSRKATGTGGAGLGTEE